MKTVEHPGPILPDRAICLDCSLASVDRQSLLPGQDLFTSLESVLDARGVPGAFFSLVAGSVAQLTLMTGGPGLNVPMTFHGPIDIIAPVSVVAGCGVIGVDEQRRRFSHCHAVFRNQANALVGGHLIKGMTIVGTEGLEVELMMLADGTFTRRTDPETRFNTLHPEVT